MADFESLLERTSRTFALAIPMLPDRVVAPARLAYLLFRTADTLEDADCWHPARRIVALTDLGRAPHAPADARRLSRAWLTDPPVMHAGYLELLAAFPELTAAIEQLLPEERSAIWGHWRQTVGRMADYQRRTGGDGVLRLKDIPDLRGYCYAVAGVVGELLTELFLLHAPSLTPAAGALRLLAPAFGEGLQLVNILKDRDADAADGRYYLPANVPVCAVVEVAHADLRAARRYVDLLREQGAPSGIIGFTAMPVLLAEAALEEIERRGAGAKVPRAHLARIGDHLLRVMAGTRPLWAVDQGSGT